MNDIKLNGAFNLKEFECPCCHTVRLSSELLQRLTRFRCILGKPVTINSGYRCPSYNAKINGDRNSYHMKGMAADIFVEGFYLEELLEVAKEVGFHGIGIYSQKNFLHLDVRPGELKIWSDHTAK